MKSKKKTKSNDPAGLWSISEKRVFIGIGLFFLIVTVISFLVSFLEDNANQNLLRSYENQEVPHNKVCSVGNEIKFDRLNPLVIEDKTYWICCDRCKARLENNINTRFATDPFSKKRINKADAAIIQNSKSKRMVLYFESIDNFLKYKEAQKNM